MNALSRNSFILKVIKVITADNSPTLFTPELNEHYGSINGAKNESIHVFINAGLKQITQQDISIHEIGFGTGLNALLTFFESQLDKKNIYYETIEKFPLKTEIIEDLTEESLFQNDVFTKMHNAPWNSPVLLADNFTLNKICIHLLDYSPVRLFNLIYFDAFSPEKQPELWTKSVFKKLYDATTQNGILVSYSSKGIVKEALRDVGYSVTRLKGPEGKRHMVRAVK